MLTRSTRLNALIAGSAVTLLLLALAVGQAAPRPASADEPVVTYMYPQEGDVFAEPLQVIQICFENPIDVRDLPPRDDGEFDFDLTRPNGLRVGLRIVFQANGYGVAVYPGIESEGIVGEWTLSYQVRDRESLDRITRTLNYEVSDSGEPIITPTPQMCPSDGGTPPAATDQPTGPDGTPDDGGTVVEEDGDSDALVLPLIAIGAAGGAAVLLLLGYAFRRRIGWWLHDPEDEPDSGDHH